MSNIVDNAIKSHQENAANLQADENQRRMVCAQAVAVCATSVQATQSLVPASEGGASALSLVPTVGQKR